MKDICSRCPNYHSDICLAYPDCGFFNYSDIYFKDLLDELEEKNQLGQKNVKALILLVERKIEKGLKIESYVLDDFITGLYVMINFNNNTSLSLNITCNDGLDDTSIITESIDYNIDDILMR